MSRSLVVTRLISAVELNIHEQHTMVVEGAKLGYARMQAGIMGRKMIHRFDDLQLTYLETIDTEAWELMLRWPFDEADSIVSLVYAVWDAYLDAGQPVRIK